MANLIEIPFNDGTTTTNALFNIPSIFEVRNEWDGAGPQNVITVYTAMTGNTDQPNYLKAIEIVFAGVGGAPVADGDITDNDVQNLKNTIANNIKTPGNIATWHPALYSLDPDRYCCTNYNQDQVLSTDI